MCHGDSGRSIVQSQETCLDSIVVEAADRVQAMGACPKWSLATAVDNALWEALIYRMAVDLAVTAELVNSFHLDLRSRFPVQATLHALRRSEVQISPVRELSVAMSVAAFLSQAAEWVLAELRERGFVAPETEGMT